MDTNDILAICSGSLSVFGSLTIMMLNIRFKEYRNHFFRRLVFLLSIYDFFQTIIFLFPSTHDSLCSVQGYYLIFNAHMPPHFSAIISYLTWLNLAHNKPIYQLKRRLNYLHLFALCFAVICTIFIGSLGQISRLPHTRWCFLTHESWILVFYIILWIDILISMTCYFLILKRIRQSSKFIRSLDNQKTIFKRSRDLKIQIRLSLVPLIVVLTLIFPSIKRLRAYINPRSKSLTWLNICHHLFNPLQGFLDFVVFVLCSQYSRSKLKEMLFCRGKKQLAVLESPIRENYSSDVLLENSQDSYVIVSGSEYDNGKNGFNGNTNSTLSSIVGSDSD
ncbi:g protein-coupled receptor [Anaeramoeba flamelloides]|uniref:G protein-coupled receptor n=1 Tax=Anaeramoeba flamelloides TaxID=1746091 RepID=A0AAV7YB98_9EUKA|nr:g protein-coupled receptor [Anaeramoeba flamelloides]